MASGAPPAWPAGRGNAWNEALRIMAANPRPETLPPDVYLRHDKHTITIYDGYPKAKFHFLIMPRTPFVTKDGTTLKLEAMDSTRSLSERVAPDHALEVIERLRDAAMELKPMIQDEMRQTPLPGQKEPASVTWPINYGFHASPSMRHVHLHVISSDLISPALKNKKHYNSFNTALEFFVPLDATLRRFREPRKPEVSALAKLGVREKEAHALKRLQETHALVSFYTGEELRNVPALKKHLQSHWETLMIERARRLRLEGSQHSADSEDSDDALGPK